MTLLLLTVQYIGLLTEWLTMTDVDKRNESSSNVMTATTATTTTTTTFGVHMCEDLVFICL